MFDEAQSRHIGAPTVQGCSGSLQLQSSAFAAPRTQLVRRNAAKPHRTWELLPYTQSPWTALDDFGIADCDAILQLPISDPAGLPAPPDLISGGYLRSNSKGTGFRRQVLCSCKELKKAMRVSFLHGHHIRLPCCDGSCALRAPPTPDLLVRCRIGRLRSVQWIPPCPFRNTRSFLVLLLDLRPHRSRAPLRTPRRSINVLNPPRG
jgi:hypothetical protein